MNLGFVQCVIVTVLRSGRKSWMIFFDVDFQIDDDEDLETMAQLLDPNPSQGFFVSATEKMLFGSLTYLPKRNIQLFAQVYRYRIPNNAPPSYFNKYFHRIVQVSLNIFNPTSFTLALIYVPRVIVRCYFRRFI